VRARAAICATLLCAAFLAGATVAHGASSQRPAALTNPAPLICIDPGHGGPFSNANGNGLTERTVNLQIGLALRKALQARGYRVIMTRTTNTALTTADTETWNLKSGSLWAYAKDRTLYRRQSIPKDDLTARTRVANTAGADLLISIHCNGAVRRSAKGVETYASPRDAMGRKLARLVQTSLVARTGRADRGANTADFYVLRWSNMPAILVEAAFISNPSDAAFLKTSTGRGRVATGIADGVDTWFAGKPYRSVLPRISAPSQVEAAVELSRMDFPAGASTVLLARTTRANDTPGVSALASRLGAALLLTSGSLPASSTLDEIVRLKPSQVLLVGFEGSIDTTGVTSALGASAVPTSAIAVIEARDPATLSVRIAEQMGAPGAGRVILVNERDSGAKMAAASIAARTGSPILLTGDTALGPAAEYLTARTGLVSSVLRLGTQYLPARYAGLARQRTLQHKSSANLLRMLNNETYPSAAAGSLAPVVTNGRKPGDVLTASVHAARLRQPVVLTAGASISPYARLYLTNKRVQTRSFWLLETGGAMPPVLHSVLAKSDYY